MKTTTLVSKMFCITAALLITACANVPVASAQNISFDGYWEMPNGWIVLFKERIFLFVNPDDGRLMGGSGGSGRFAIDARHFILQPARSDAITFDYTVIDSGSIRVIDNGGINAWANGTWRKRNDIRGTAVNNRIIGYWEGKRGNNTWLLYIAGRDIMPSDYDGFLFIFDQGNSLDMIFDLWFEDRYPSTFLVTQPGTDVFMLPFRFDGADLLIDDGQLQWFFGTQNTEIRFVRR